MNMMLKYFEDIETGIEKKLSQDPESKTGRKIYALEIARLGKRLYSSNGNIAWCGFTAPLELLNTFGVTSCFVEFVGAMLASMGIVGTFMEESEHAGFAPDTCGYHRSVIGALRKGAMPVPDFIVASTCPCTGGVAVMENMALAYKKDLFVLNIPQEKTVKNVRYLAEQIKNLENFISRHTGKSLDKQRLRDSMEKVNQAREIMTRVYKLSEQVPSPTSSRDLNNFGITMPLFFGTDAAVDIAQAYLDEFSARSESGISGVPDEKLRLMWIQNRIQFPNPLIRMLENDYHATIVIDELNDITWDPIDPDDPYTGMALRAISLPFNGEASQRIVHLKKLARDYHVHGAINPCNWGCRQGAGARGLVAEGLKEIGVPVLNLEIDCVDSRNFAEGQMRTRIEAFMEMLSSRPSPWET